MPMREPLECSHAPRHADPITDQTRAAAPAERRPGALLGPARRYIVRRSPLSMAGSRDSFMPDVPQPRVAHQV
eukprot:464266-Prymnesium_polylepis.1